MTKFILHGGKTREKTAENNLFWQEMFRDTPDDVNYVGIYFARPQEVWEEKFDADNERIQKSNPEKNILFRLATRENISEEIQTADVIFFSGGEFPITPFLKHVDLKKLLHGKIVAGSSAGVYVLSQYYYSNDRKVIEEGSGVLPIKTMCHYSEEMLDVCNELNNYKACLDVHTLKEGEMIMLYH